VCALAGSALGAIVITGFAQHSATEAPADFNTPSFNGAASVSNGIEEPTGDSFALDQQLFERNHQEKSDTPSETGLGPVYNGTACASCHENPNTGGASQITELRVGHTDDSGNFVNPTILVNLNLLGLLYCTHAALPHLLAAAELEPRSVADVVNVSSVAGRVARLNSGVYNATKHGVGAFSESLRQEVTKRHVRVTIIEPGAVGTELAFHNRPEILEGMAQNFEGIEIMQATDIAESIRYAVTQPRRVAVNEILVRPTEQER
jgi:hypothetical protein